MGVDICLVDPEIRDRVGHYYEYALAIRQAAHEVGAGFAAWANRKVGADISLLLGAEPTFRYSFWHRFTSRRKLRWFLNPLLCNAAFYQDLSRAASGRLSANQLFFMPTVDHHQMMAWAWWLTRQPAHRRPKVVLLLRYTYFWGDSAVPWRDAWWLRLAQKLLSPSIKSGHLILATDSHRLATQYESLGVGPMVVLPIPHTADIRVASEADAGLRTAATRFVFLGDAREEKGFGLIAQLIKRLCLYAPALLREIEFILQCPITHVSHGPMLSHQTALADLQHPSVRLIPQVLDRSEYLQLLLEANVVMLPYSRGVYFARTSGPFSEALAAGKPVLVTNDTWMSDQLASGGAGLTMTDGDVDDLGRAVLGARQQIDELTLKAKQRQPSWLATHNPSSLVRDLLAFV
jgi:glycosyltransferase involved in cell wall biosynthesis